MEEEGHLQLTMVVKPAVAVAAISGTVLAQQRQEVSPSSIMVLEGNHLQKL